MGKVGVFEIKVLPPSERGADGQRLGRITIGDFTERFSCYYKESTTHLEARWRNELRKLVQGKSAIALVHDPRFAWIVYREGKVCFVQQRLAINGVFYPIAPRMTHGDDGHQVSEWTTNISAIERFVNDTS